MNSLVNYGSDDDYDDSSEEKATDWRGSSTSKEKTSTPADNYEEVQMELSEGSNDSPKPEVKESRRSRERDSKDRRERNSRDRYDRKSRDYNYSRRDRDRKSRRSTSREKRRSRTPRKSERDARHSRSRSKSRSRSRDRSRKYNSKRYDRKNDQTDRNDRQKEDEKRTSNQSDSNRFFMPGITGRFRDQIERRKQLWQKKDAPAKDNNTNDQSKKVWETTTFAQDTDGKVASKFKRLMGIKNSTESDNQAVDVLRKQEEMFSSMEQQYEVARTATHTMRGVGLGFGSYQR